jgi:hypothetical protein
LAADFVPAYRTIVDDFHETEIGLVNTHDNNSETQNGYGANDGSPLQIEAVHDKRNF